MCREARLQRRYRHSSEDCRRCVGARCCNRGSVTTGGLRPPALVPAKMLSCIAKVAFSPPSERRAPGAAGVSPPCVTLTHLQRRFRNCSADCRPVRWRTPLQPRSCNYAELTPLALGAACVRWCRANVCGIFLAGAVSEPRGAYAPRSWSCRRSPADGIATFAMHKRTRTGAAGVSPPWCGNRACEDNSHTFADDCRTRNQERRVSARRASR